MIKLKKILLEQEDTPKGVPCKSFLSAFKKASMQVDLKALPINDNKTNSHVLDNLGGAMMQNAFCNGTPDAKVIYRFQLRTKVETPESDLKLDPLKYFKDFQIQFIQRDVAKFDDANAQAPGGGLTRISKDSDGAETETTIPYLWQFGHKKRAVKTALNY